MVWQLEQGPVTFADTGNGKLIRKTAAKITEKIKNLIDMFPVNLCNL
jgi:hypothetical protein